jgi:hypothetical protein
MDIEDVGRAIGERVDDVAGHGEDSDEAIQEDSIFQDYLIALELFPAEEPTDVARIDPLNFIPEIVADFDALKAKICLIADRIDVGLRLPFVKAVIHALAKNTHRARRQQFADRIRAKV